MNLNNIHNWASRVFSPPLPTPSRIKYGTGSQEPDMRCGDIVAPPGNQAETENTKMWLIRKDNYRTLASGSENPVACTHHST
jgi:hypothetical protein